MFCGPTVILHNGFQVFFMQTLCNGEDLLLVGIIGKNKYEKKNKLFYESGLAIAYSICRPPCKHIHERSHVIFLHIVGIAMAQIDGSGRVAKLTMI
eukprot:g40040.t1